jgi:hypothetical protein
MFWKLSLWGSGFDDARDQAIPEHRFVFESVANVFLGQACIVHCADGMTYIAHRSKTAMLRR